MNAADDLTARIQQIAERAKQRPRAPAPEPTPKPARVVRLPLWPEERVHSNFTKATKQPSLMQPPSGAGWPGAIGHF